jgi:hypothetical protein
MNKRYLWFFIIYLCLHVPAIGDDTINRRTSIKEFTPGFQNDATLYVWLHNLRIREEPELSSKIIGRLQFADEVEYLNEMSDMKSKAIIRGNTYNAPWIKVKTGDGMIGWVYGVGLKSDFIEIYAEPGYSEDQLNIAHFYENLSPFIPNEAGDTLVAIEPIPDPSVLTRALYGKEYVVHIKYVGEKQRTGDDLFTFEWGEGSVYEVLGSQTVSYDGLVVDDGFLEGREFIPLTYIIKNPSESQAYKELRSRIEQLRKWKINDLWIVYSDDDSKLLALVLHEEYKGYVMLSIVLATPKEVIFHDHIAEHREGEDLFRVDDMGEFDPSFIGVDFLFKVKDGYELVYYWDGAEGRNIYIVKQLHDRFILGRRIYQPVSY